ncbi:MAG: hypothetical protein J5750_04640 [Clostridiales bacterium]|nr:hypothetical protein [Clostridiales bacterium]
MNDGELINDKDLYSGTIVYENKNAKRNGFLINVIGGTLFSAIFAVSWVLQGSSKGFDQPARTWIIAIGIAVCCGLALGIYRVVTTKKIRVAISDTDVDVTVGQAHGIYPVSSYFGHFKRTSDKKRAVIRELGFRNTEEEESEDLYVGLPDIPGSLFRDIVDAICIKKRHLPAEEEEESSEAGDEYAPFEGNSYKRRESDPEPDNTKMILILSFVLGVMVTAGMIIVTYVGLINYAVGVFFSCIFAVLLLIGIIGCPILLRHEKKMKDRDIRELSFHESFIKLNGEVYEFKDIASVYMTLPYLQDVSDDTRDLCLTLKSTGKKVCYFIGWRPSEKNTEGKLTEDCSCEYSALFARIRKICEEEKIGFTVFR